MTWLLIIPSFYVIRKTCCVLTDSLISSNVYTAIILIAQENAGINLHMSFVMKIVF